MQTTPDTMISWKKNTK